MENVKYIIFYLLLVALVVAGGLDWHWLSIVPSALILTSAVIFVKGKDWRKVMGEAEMNATLVFVATYLSQILLSAILFGLGRLIRMLF